MAHTVVFSPQAPAPIGPYSQAIRAGSTVYVSGQIALDANGQLVGGGDVAAETHQVMRNLEAVLTAAGGIVYAAWLLVFARDTVADVVALIRNR